MKNNPTPSEKAAEILLNTLNVRYLNQQVFGFYILDFVIPSKLLVLEIDGSSHDNKKDYDQRRDHFIREAGLQVIHIPNRLVHTIPTLLQDFPDISPSLQWEIILGKVNDMNKLRTRGKRCRKKSKKKK